MSKLTRIVVELKKTERNLKETMEELVFYEKVISQSESNVIVSSPSEMDILRPKMFHGSRNTKGEQQILIELRTILLLSLCCRECQENYQCPLNLEDKVIVLWRRRHNNIVEGTSTINMWDKFKRD